MTKRNIAAKMRKGFTFDGHYLPSDHWNGQRKFLSAKVQEEINCAKRMVGLAFEVGIAAHSSSSKKTRKRRKKDRKNKIYIVLGMY
jgi:hypothetical protein